MAATSLATSLLRRALVAPVIRSPASLPAFSSRAYVVIPRAVKQSNNKVSVSVEVSTKGGRFASSKVTAADANLKSVIDAEIESVEESDYFKQEFEVPDKFPFEIIDNLGDQAVILKREFNGETIKVTVFADYEESPEDPEDDKEDEDDEEEEEEEEEAEEYSGRQNLNVVVTVEKGEGPFLEFLCNFSDDGYSIESMVIKKADASVNDNSYLGPEFA